MTQDIVINEQELDIIIDALQYRSGEIKHDGEKYHGS